MALLQTFPEFSVERIPVEQEMPEPAIEPMEVAFRRGGQLDNLINTIQGCRYVLVDAAPGAGKSSVLPVELAKRTGSLVVLVLPYEPLAYVTYLYLLRKHKGDPFRISYMVDTFEEFPVDGLVVTHAGWLAAHWCGVGYAQLPECYLLQDECHESGAASAFVREFAPYLSSVRSYVMMSATIGPTNFRSMETGGNVVERAIEGDYYDTMSSLATGMHEWSPSRMRGHVLFFEDDLDCVRGIRLAYTKLGVKVFHWHAHIDPYEFASQYGRLFESRDEFIVIVADSTFRSGYTLPVNVIVDSGKISRKVVINNAEATMTRSIYACEKQQSKARGGRLDGQSTVYHVPPQTPEKKMTTLEQVDVEAMALLCKLIGRSSRLDLSAATMSGSLVPKEVWRALTAAEPLAVIPRDQLVDLPTYNSTKEREKPARLNRDPQRSEKAAEGAYSITSRADELSFDSLLGQFDETFVQKECEYGRYLACDVDSLQCPEIIRRSEVALIVRRVSRALEGKAYCQEAGYDEAVSLLSLIDEYNSKIATLAAFKLVVRRIREIGVSAKDEASLRRYLTHMSYQSADHSSDCASLFRIICSGYFRKFRIRHDDSDYSDREQAIAQRHLATFESVKTKAIYSIDNAMKAAYTAVDEIAFVDQTPKKRFLSISN